MSSIFTIAWRDIKSYFVSPKGATILFFFCFMMGLFYYSFISSFIEMQQRAPMYGGEAPTLEQLLRAFAYNINFVLVLIIPAITMSSFSEERRNQTLRLLQTSPLSAFQIVMGKYLAAVCLLVIVLMAAAVYPMFTIVYGNPDITVVFVSFFGLFLLMCSQVAFGLWVSSMTSNQFVAFLFTMFGLFILLILNWLSGSLLQGSGISQDVLKYIASSDHLDVFFKGMLSVADLSYFLCFTALFLFFTNVALDSQRWR